jgi:hypothetical protein
MSPRTSMNRAPKPRAICGRFCCDPVAQA